MTFIHGRSERTREDASVWVFPLVLYPLPTVVEYFKAPIPHKLRVDRFYG